MRVPKLSEAPMNLPLDIYTLNAAEAAILASLMQKAAEWKSLAAKEGSAGNFATASQVENWAFAAGLLTHLVSNELSELLASRLGAGIPPAAEKVPEVDLSGMPEKTLAA